MINIRNKNLFMDMYVEFSLNGSKHNTKVFKNTKDFKNTKEFKKTQRWGEVELQQRLRVNI